MLKDITVGLYRTAEGGVAQIHKVGRLPDTKRLLAFGMVSPKRGKAHDDSWDATNGAHVGKPEWNLVERVTTIGESQRG